MKSAGIGVLWKIILSKWSEKPNPRGLGFVKNGFFPVKRKIRVRFAGLQHFEKYFIKIRRDGCGRSKSDTFSHFEKHDSFFFICFSSNNQNLVHISVTQNTCFEFLKEFPRVAARAKIFRTYMCAKILCATHTITKYWRFYACPSEGWRAFRKIDGKIKRRALVKSPCV